MTKETNPKFAAIVIDAPRSTLSKGSILPIEWWLHKLSNYFDTDVFILDPDEKTIKYLKKYKKINIYEINTNRTKSRLNKHFFTSIFSRKVSIHSTSHNNIKLSKDYSLICACPITAVEAANLIFNGHLIKAKTVAVISDSISSTYKYISKEATNLVDRFLAMMKYWRCNLFVVEQNVLKNYNYIIVQSYKDKLALLNKGKNNFRGKIKCLPNGVVQFDDVTKLNKNSFMEREIDVLFWSENWISANKYMADTINTLVVSQNNFKIQVLGSASSYIKKLELNNQVKILNWIENLYDHLSNVKFLVVPAFKNFGLINRVLDGLNAGCVVISEKTAFNGIVGFENSIHGLIAPDGNYAAKIITETINNQNKLIQISKDAQKLIATNHSWKQHEKFYEEIYNEIT